MRINRALAAVGLEKRLSQLPIAGPILAIYVVAGLALEPAFVSATNLNSIFFSVAVLLPAVVGMQLLLVLGRFDLSIGATASLAGMVTGLTLLQSNSIALAIVLGSLVGFGGGLIVGILVTTFRIDPLVATLAGMGVFRSLALVINDGRIVAGLPETFGTITESRLGNVPTLLPVAGIFVVSSILAVRHAVVFRRFYAVGSNPVAAAHIGLNVGRITTIGFILAGLGSAISGILQASRTLSASPSQFISLPIEAIAACLIGGGTLTGGRGSILGAVAGLLVVCATTNLVAILGISVFWKDFAVGLLLLLAVLIRPLTTTIRENLFMKNQK